MHERQTSTEHNRIDTAKRSARFKAAILDYCAIWIPPTSLIVIFLLMLDFKRTFDTLLISLFIWLTFITAMQCLLLARYNQTVGKMVMDIKIVSLNHPSIEVSPFTLIILRGLFTNILYNIPLFFIVDSCFIFKKDKRCLHDWMTNTIVVNSPRLFMEEPDRAMEKNRDLAFGGNRDPIDPYDRTKQSIV